MRALRADEIELRVGTVGKKGVTLLCYKNARVDRQILDEEYGQMNWVCDYKELKGNMYCGIGVWDADKGMFVYKWDCGTESNTEKEKGEASDAFKRAGFRWGIGIELYTSPFIFLQVATDQVSETRYKMHNPYELSGIYVSHIDTDNGVIKEMDIAQGNKVIWSTDRRKVGADVERSYE